MSDRHMKVIGCFAHKGMEAVCTEGLACLIAGSHDTMARYLVEMGQDEKSNTIKKTRFGEILGFVA
ncbi:MAG: hypothetical protein HQL80_09220 [Magnetococcales bacterium]|nr:hypothetical protein [Magnetococcales bacterium]